jgi:hypothetical protein
MAFQRSIASYPDRGPYGSPKYRGNTTGRIIHDMLEFCHPSRDLLFADPAEGGGTSRDVAAEMGIRYTGMDLQSGFNILRDDLAAHLGECAQTIFFHPPYWGMIKYSDSEEDLSNAKSLEEFLEKIQLAAMNIYDALAGGGHYAVLMGNWRKRGTYYPLASLLETILPGKLREEIIKVQYNVSSLKTPYTNNGSFIPIAHEKLLIYRKDKMVFGLDYAIDLSRFQQELINGTWRNLVQRVLMQHGGASSLEGVYQAVEGTPKAQANPNWKAKVRQVLGQNPEFIRIAPAQYQLA